MRQKTLTFVHFFLRILYFREKTGNNINPLTGLQKGKNVMFVSLHVLKMHIEIFQLEIKILTMYMKRNTMEAVYEFWICKTRKKFLVMQLIFKCIAKKTSQ